MFEASFILHAFGNDVTTGTAHPYTANTWTALPLGLGELLVLRRWAHWA